MTPPLSFHGVREWELDSVPGVYVITCEPTGRSYIGSAQNVRSRVMTHETRLGIGQHINKEFQADWDAFGAAAFTIRATVLLGTGDEHLKRLRLAEREMLDLCRNEATAPPYNPRRPNIPGACWREACEECGRSFYAFMPPGRYCCRDCYTAARRRQKAEQARAREGIPPANLTAPPQPQGGTL
jgi:rRNA maturation protein Nop10